MPVLPSRSRLHPRAQVLPPEMIQFAQPSVSSLVDAVADAIPLTKHVVPADFHEKVRHMYSWDEVAARTEQVYFKIAVTPRPSLIERFERYSSVGPVAGVLCCFIAASVHLYWRCSAANWSADLGYAFSQRNGCNRDGF